MYDNNQKISFEQESQFSKYVKDFVKYYLK